MSIVREYDREELRHRFQTAEPYPHFIVENFLSPDFCSSVANSYPSYADARSLGHEFDAVNERLKIQITDAGKFPAPVARLNEFLASPGFLADLSYITGIPKLLADSDLLGGGMHMTGPGGRLDVHIDFNYVRDRKLYRRLNILIYLNERWDDSWGGQIELWNKDVSRCEVAVTPLLNRCVLFETSEISFHGVRPIANSPGRVRKSFAAYYYTYEPPPNWSGQDHSTVFKARPDEAFRGYVMMPAQRMLDFTRSSIRKAKNVVKKALRI